MRLVENKAEPIKRFTHNQITECKDHDRIMVRENCNHSQSRSEEETITLTVTEQEEKYN
jgi:hypothetical protein